MRLPRLPAIRLPVIRTLIVPTPRAVLALVLAAPVALLLGARMPGAWVAAPLFGAGLLALVLLDGVLAARLIAAKVAAPGEIEVGAAGSLAVLAEFARRPRRAEAALAVDARLAPGGKIVLALTPDAAEGVLSGKAGFTAARRGTGEVIALWLRWTGPLGLGARQHSEDIGAAMRVVPNIGAVRSPALQAFLRDSELGLIARRLRGDGTLFEALAEYQPGMDRRRIDWKVSARHARLHAREYESERNNQITFAFDCGQAMCEPVAGMARLDRAISAALTAAYVALRGGDRVALYGFAARVSLATPFVTGAGGFARLQSAAAALDYEAREPNFTLALASLAARLQRRTLIVVFSDFTDPTSAELMVESIGRLTARHRVLFVTMNDEELEGIAAAPPRDAHGLAMAVTADALLRQRALVVQRLRRLGVDVIAAPYTSIGTRLIDAYLAIRQRGGIG